MNILYLLNPTSGENKALERWQTARKQHPELPEMPIDVTQIADLPRFIKEQEPDLIAIAGGDGTINAVASAVLQLEKKPFLTILPFGFGNALSYCFGVETVDKALHVLKEQPHTVTIDIMQTTIPKHPYGLFNISAGFDARVVYNRMNQRYIRTRSYILAALRGYFEHKETTIIFTVDHKVTMRATASSLVVANCPVIGQNYVVSPGARLNDGYLDCTLFSTKFTYLTNLRLKGFRHPLYSQLGKVYFKAKHIRIEGEPFVQVDGDPVVRKEGIEISMHPHQLTFLRNDTKQIDSRYVPFVT